MKAKTREAIAGYLFIIPIMTSVAVFTIIPIFQAFYYSFTDYDALKQQMFNATIDPLIAVGSHLMVLPEEIENTKELAESLDPVSLVEDMVGTSLPDRLKVILRREFDRERLVEDYRKGFEGIFEGEVTVRDFLERYLMGDKGAFSKYVPNFVGLENFKSMLDDEYFWIALKNSFVFAAVVTPIQTLLALVLAVAANSKVRGVSFFKTSFFIPSITSSAAISMIFLLLYSKPGLINRLLGIFGFEPIDWLGNPRTALTAVMAMNIWTTAGYFMVTFLAGLQNIPRSIIEAAIIDGANGWTRFWKITLPLLRPQITFVVTMGIIGTLQVFDQIYFLIKSQENVTMAMYIYQNAFRYGKMGYASAIALVFFLIIFLVTLVQRRLMERNLEVM